MSVFLAYDGSFNGDWIARYALHFARGNQPRRLTVLHVEDANISGEPLHTQLRRLEELGKSLGVTVEVQLLPMHDGVFGGLSANLPTDPDSILLCGARASVGRRGLLTGTISERLLCDTSANVLAIRVLQPGLLGAARRLMLPLPDSGDISTAFPYIRPLATGIEKLDFLRLAVLSHRRFNNLTDAEAGRLRHDAKAFIARAEEVITAMAAVPQSVLDGHVRVTDDWPKQVAVEAGRYRSDLILTDMTDRKAPFTFAHPIEELMRIAPCNVAVYRSGTMAS